MYPPLFRSAQFSASLHDCAALHQNASLHENASMFEYASMYRSLLLCMSIEALFSVLLYSDHMYEYRSFVFCTFLQ